ncbi:MAG: YegP family protein, partial [Saprospiraceae bacterium]|nr:YegP family protein [Saprospiraceae bacterium]
MSNQFREDNYLPCSDYRGHKANKDGFAAFEFSNGQFYFSIVDASGNVLFRSEGYSTISSRDNGMDSVQANMHEEEQYFTKQLIDGRWVLCMKSKNHQEIARSCPAATEEEVKAYLPSEREKAAKAAKALNKETEDDYLICSIYRDNLSKVSPVNNDFISFTHSNGDHYFAMVENGEVIFRSEGYKSEKSRDNGIDSVLRNRDIEEHYGIVSSHGIYFTVLKAGNLQEIARSCPYKSEEEARSLFPSERAKAAALKSKKSSAQDDDYLICGEYEEQIENTSSKYPGFISFTHQNGEHYFALIDEGKILLRSEGYASESARDNGIESVIKNQELEERYSMISAHGAHFTILKAGNHQEIARSCPKKSEEEAKAIFPSERVKATALKSKKSSAQDDDYLICGEYEEQIENSSDKYPGFISFMHQNGEHYFALVEDGKILLRSEGYASEEARDNGIESVIKNQELEERYGMISAHGAHFTILKAGNHQEIARSCPKKSEEEAKAIFPSERAKAAALKSKKSSAQDDDYLICGEYEEQIENTSDKYPGFISFMHQNGEHYFALVEDGKILLRSEGYISEDARDNGIESVIKNQELEERYSIISAHGAHFTILKSGNHQEIARSCPKKSEGEAKAIFPSERAKAAAPATPLPLAEKKIVPPPPPKPATPLPLAEKKIVPPPPPAPPKKKEVDDNYLHCKEYQGHPIADKMNRVAFFKHAGELYFAIYKEDGSVRLRSEGFETVAARDKELAIALRHLNTPERYSIIRNGDLFIKILKDVDGREVGRSCLEKDEPAPTLSTTNVVAAAVAATAAAPIAAAVKKDKEDDYLECKHYMGHAISDKENKVAFFQNNGQYYFVIYYADGRVRLRSEGFTNTANRESELKAALRHLD